MINTHSPRDLARRRLLVAAGAVAVCAIIIFIVQYALTVDNATETSENTAGPILIILPDGIDREAISRKLAKIFSWNKSQRTSFLSIYAQMEWDAYKEWLDPLFVNRFGWEQMEREIFLASSAYYRRSNMDFLKTVYAPGKYEIAESSSMSEIAEILIGRFEESAGEDIASSIEDRLYEPAVLSVAEFVEQEFDLLPDLVPLPAKDLSLKRQNGKAVLRFSTTYYNQGRGPLELKADPKTAGLSGDITRNVYQRIYRRDGSYRDIPVGTFLWHEPHLHYHFADFVAYDLEMTGTPIQPRVLSGVKQKTTFCVRDISRVSLEEKAEVSSNARYLICKKELQGISVGWGDTYFHTYPDQQLDVTDLPSGTYRLSFAINPENRFEESDTGNNKSSALLEIDQETQRVRVLAESPSEYPSFEHIYKEQPL